MQIRKLTLDDLSIRVNWMNNPLVYESMHFSTPVLLNKTIEWFNRNRERVDRVDFSFINDSKEIVAFGGITSINKEVAKAETYIFTNPNLHNKGVGTEAMILLCQYGFKTLGLNKLYAFINKENEASIRLHCKIGYEIEGRLRQEYKDCNGTMKDRLYLGYLVSDYNK